MSTKIHFVNVGQGNMTLLQLDNGKTFLYDCNITNDNKDKILDYLYKQLGWKNKIDVFICSHRDADHMRGIEIIHNNFPIQYIWDSGVTGTTTNSSEYIKYMELRRQIGFKEIEWQTYYDFGNTRLRIFNSRNNDLNDSANAQSIVIKVVQRDNRNDVNHDSVLLTGDTDATTWKYLQKYYNNNDLSCSLLLASHHGSLSYFDDPNDTHYYLKHLSAKSPAMTIISVGGNAHGHPDDKALEFYERFSTGSNTGRKILRTDKHENIFAELKDHGGWSLSSTRRTKEKVPSHV